jgi:cytochrome c
VELAEQLITEMELDPVTQNELRTAWGSCLECHGVDPGVSGAAPSLAGLMGRPVASTGFTAYSAGLRAKEGRWSREELANYLADPASAVPGTTMPDPGIGDRRVLERLLDVLDGLTNTAETERFWAERGGGAEAQAR